MLIGLDSLGLSFFWRLGEFGQSHLAIGSAVINIGWGGVEGRHPNPGAYRVRKVPDLERFCGILQRRLERGGSKLLIADHLRTQLEVRRPGIRSPSGPFENKGVSPGSFAGTFAL